jgi:hypothetical protein
MRVERRGRVVRDCVRSINSRAAWRRSRVDELKAPGKPFGISKRAVWEAWEKVKANKGAAGVDGVSIEEFEKDLRGNLYKIWNRMSSGTYFPPAVRAVEIAKSHGGGTRSALGGALCQAVAGRTAGIARRDLARAQPWDPTGVSGFASARQSVLALRVYVQELGHRPILKEVERM